LLAGGQLSKQLQRPSCQIPNAEVLRFLGATNAKEGTFIVSIKTVVLIVLKGIHYQDADFSISDN
jgi:hypothetical protein